MRDRDKHISSNRRIVILHIVNVIPFKRHRKSFFYFVIIFLYNEKYKPNCLSPHCTAGIAAQLGSFISHNFNFSSAAVSSARWRQISNARVRIVSRRKSLFPASLFAPLPFINFCMSCHPEPVRYQ